MAERYELCHQRVEAVSGTPDGRLSRCLNKQGNSTPTSTKTPHSSRIGFPLGVVTLSQIRRLPRPCWSTTTLLEAGTPTKRMTFAHPQDRLFDALATMKSDDGRVIVIDEHGQLVGLVTPSDVTAAFDRGVIGRRSDPWKSSPS